MAEVIDKANVVWRDFEEPNNPASGARDPDKTEIREFAEVIEQKITGTFNALSGLVDEAIDLVDSTISLGAPSWTALAAVAGTRQNQRGRSTEAGSGTHTDPVTGATGVLNRGDFLWNMSPPGWTGWSALLSNTIADVPTVIAGVNNVDTVTSFGFKGGLDARLAAEIGIQATSDYRTLPDYSIDACRDVSGRLRFVRIGDTRYERVADLVEQLGNTIVTSDYRTIGDVIVEARYDVSGRLRVRTIDGGESANFYAVDASDITGLPAGGAAEQILVKQSATDGDALWSAAGSRLPVWAAGTGVSPYTQDRAIVTHGATVPSYSNNVFPSSVRFGDLDQTLYVTEGWDAQRLCRAYYVRAWSRSLNKWSDSYLIGLSGMVDDDHGQLAIERDHNGYFHAFGGSHVVSMYHWRSKRPNDITEWVFVERIGTTGASYGYPHPTRIGKRIFLFARKWDGATGFDAVLHIGTVGDGGAIAWTAARIVIHFDADNRVYMHRHHRRGTLIDIMFARADFANTLRAHAYFATYDTVAGNFTNLAGTVTASTLTETVANASFRLETTPATTGLMSAYDFGWDEIDPTKLHLMVFNPGDPAIKYRTYTVGGGVATASSDTVISTLNDTGTAQLALTTRSEGGCDLWYNEVIAAESPSGKVYRRPVIGGDISPPILIAAPERSYELTSLAATRDGDSATRITFCERSADPNTEIGDLRLYAEGDAGPVWSDHVGCTVSLKGYDAVTPALPSGSPIGLLRALAPATAGPVLSVASGGPFTVSNGYLTTTGGLTAGVYYPVIEAKDGAGVTLAKRIVPVRVAPALTYGFANPEASDYVDRTCLAWSIAHVTAIDTFVSGLKTASLWSKFDLIVPPSRGAYAGKHNLKSSSFVATLVHGAQPVIHEIGADTNAPVPPGPWKTSGVDNRIGTGFNPATAGGNFSRNSACMMLDFVAGTTGGAVIGFLSGTSGVAMQIASTSVSARINQANASTGTIATRSGLFTANRSASGAVQLYRGAAALTLTAGATEASIAIVNGEISIGYAGATPGYREVSAAGWAFGSSLTAGEVSTFNTLWIALKAALGIT